MFKSVIARMCVGASVVVALVVAEAGMADAAPAGHGQVRLSVARQAVLRGDDGALTAAVAKGDPAAVRRMTYAVTGDLPVSVTGGPAVAGARSRAGQLPGVPFLTGSRGPGIGATLIAVCSLSFRTVVSVQRIVRGALGPVPVPPLPDGCPVSGVPFVPTLPVPPAR